LGWWAPFPFVVEEDALAILIASIHTEPILKPGVSYSALQKLGNSWFPVSEKFVVSAIILVSKKKVLGVRRDVFMFWPQRAEGLLLPLF
jgi:hypothetical protein